MLFQNNAESRGTGGNPAAVVLVNVTDGKISIAKQANSGDFNNNRPEPIIELQPRDRRALRRQDRALHARHHAHSRLHRER